ncbi:MAG: septum formation initiator family protein [Patescibacteria group bacterium]
MSNTNEKQSTLKKFFSSANLMLALVIISIFLFGNLAQQTIKYFSIKKEIGNLEKEIKKLEEKNLEMTASLEYLNSEFYKEKEARLKFGLQKPGEKVIILVPTKDQEQIETEAVSSPKKESNLMKWWKYFMK